MTEQEKIDDIMDNFNFSRVKMIMQTLDWKWATEKEMAVPSEPLLRSKARSLLKLVLSEIKSIEKKEHVIATGGFEAWAFKDDDIIKDDDVISLELKFVAVDYLVW
jgi:hypothetical protein